MKQGIMRVGVISDRAKAGPCRILTQINDTDRALEAANRVDRRLFHVRYKTLNETMDGAKLTRGLATRRERCEHSLSNTWIVLKQASAVGQNLCG